MMQAMPMTVIDAVIGIVNGLSFAGPLFRGAAQINRQLHDARLTGKALAQRLEDF